VVQFPPSGQSGWLGGTWKIVNAEQVERWKIKPPNKKKLKEKKNPNLKTNTNKKRTNPKFPFLIQFIQNFDIESMCKVGHVLCGRTFSFARTRAFVTKHPTLRIKKKGEEENKKKTTRKVKSPKTPYEKKYLPTLIHLFRDTSFLLFQRF
jgi:hypothetical protein